MKFEIDHSNLNVLDLEKSLTFYKKALGIVETRRKETDTFTLVFLNDSASNYKIELTYLHGRKDPYDLGDNEIHLCFRTDNYAAAYAMHKEMGCICYENPEMDLYFIEDPDGYWIEIISDDRQ